MIQTTSTPIPDRFAGLTGQMPEGGLVSPRFILGLLTGAPGSGKTNFLLSCPTALLWNLDRTSLPISTPETSNRVWPGLDERGNTVDGAGNPLKVDWEQIVRFKDTLVQRALKNEPRPDMIIIDSLLSLIFLGQQYILSKAKGGKDVWEDLDGRWAYPKLASMIADQIVGELRLAGYGVWGTAHIANRVIPIGDEKNVIEPKLSVFASLWGRLHGNCDLSLLCEIKIESKIEKVPLKGTKSMTTKTTTEQVRYLRSSSDEYIGIIRGKEGFPDFPIPKHNAWEQFEKLYTSLRQPEKESTTDDSNG